MHQIKKYYTVAAFCLGFAIIGLVTLLLTIAAVPTANIEPENGTITGSASVVTNSNASGGQAIQFKATTTAKPGPTNTGPTTPEANLTVFVGNKTLGSGERLEHQYVKGFVTIAGDGVYIGDSVIEGGVATGNGGVVNIQSGTGITLDHVTIKVAHPSVYLDGIWGDNFTGQYMNISGSVDGMKIGSNTTIKNSWIHDMRFFASDPNQGGGQTHNDAIQILDGTNLLIDSNNLQMIASNNSSIQITQDYGVVSRVTMQSNWADGGGCTFNISNKGQASLSNIFAYNNRFGRNTQYNACPILISTKTTLTQSGNVYDDNSQPIGIQQHD